MSSHVSGVPKKFASPSRNRPNRSPLSVNELESRSVPAATTAYIATDLVSDQVGVAPVVDTNLVNAWGISLNSSSGFWVTSNGAGLSTIYTGDVGGSPVVKQALEVTIPGGAPTGQVSNSTSDFVVTNGTD